MPPYVIFIFVCLQTDAETRITSAFSEGTSFPNILPNFFLNHIQLILCNIFGKSISIVKMDLSEVKQELVKLEQGEVFVVVSNAANKMNNNQIVANFQKKINVAVTEVHRLENRIFLQYDEMNDANMLFSMHSILVAGVKLMIRAIRVFERKLNALGAYYIPFDPNQPI